MKRIRICALVVSIGFTAAACTQTAASAGGSQSQIATYNGLPTDASIAAVSVSQPSPGAAAAMDFCMVSQIGASHVAGMGQIAHAADAYQYAPLTQREPQLATSSPVWMIQFQGEIPQPMTGEVWIDPICLYGIDGQGWFAVGPVLLPNGAIATPAPVPEPPTKSLPALTP